MSVVMSLPPTLQRQQLPAASPVESVARAKSAAEVAYQNFLASRSFARQAGGPLQAQQIQAPAARENPVAAPLQPAGVPINMAWTPPPGTNFHLSLPSVSAAPAAAIAPAPTFVQATASTLSARQGSVQQLPLPLPSGFSMQASALPARPTTTVYQQLLTGLPAALASGGSPPVSPRKPVKITEGLPDPTSVDRQKLQHARSLLDKLQSDTATLTQQNQVRKQMLAQYGVQQKAQHATQVDSDLQREAMQVEQRGNAQLLQLQQAVMAQTMALEQQAATLTLRYQCQLAEEDRVQKDYNLQRQYYDVEMKIAEQMQRVGRGDYTKLEACPESSVVTQRGVTPGVLGSEHADPYRDNNSFTTYLGNPGGVPRPPPRSPALMWSDSEVSAFSGKAQI